MRKINISINDNEVGQIGNGETKTYEVQTGKNAILGSIKEGKSNILIVNVSENSDVKLTIRISKFDTVSTLISFLTVPSLIIFLGPNFYLNYIYYLTFFMFYAIYLILRKSLNITAFVISQG